MPFVVTRPRRDGERTAAALQSRGHAVLLAPLMRVEPIAADLSGDWGAVVVTSANALEVLTAPARAGLAGLPLLAVGARSAEAARQAGFADVTSADGNARDLMRLIAGQRAKAKAPLLYLAGEDRAADLVGELAARGVVAAMRVVYRAARVPFPDALVAALKAGNIQGVLHFSKRSGHAYVTGARQAGETDAAFKVRHYCLSAQVAEPLAAAGAKTVLIAARPEEAALIELLDAPPG